MKSLRETERRRPDLLVAIAFLWAPAILIVTLSVTRDPEILIPALILAALPYIAVIIWPFVAVFREGTALNRFWLVLGILTLLVLATSVSLGPPPEY